MNDNERRKHDEARGHPETLTRLLRDADPAVGDPGLSPTEVAQMRRAITDAAPEGNNRHRAPIAWPAWIRAEWTQPALALATIGIMALGLWLFVGPRPATPPTPVADAGTAAIPPPVEPAVVIPGQAAVVLDPRAMISDQPAAVQDQPAPIPDQPVAAAPGPPAATVLAPTPAETVAATHRPSPPDVRTRTVQFTAPRGTRIIWTLNPDFVSPTSGPDARQEQGK